MAIFLGVPSCPEPGGVRVRVRVRVRAGRRALRGRCEGGGGGLRGRSQPLG